MKRVYYSTILIASIFFLTFVCSSCNGKAAKAGMEFAEKAVSKGAKYADDAYRVGKTFTTDNENEISSGNQHDFSTDKQYEQSQGNQYEHSTGSVCYSCDGTGLVESVYQCPYCYGSGMIGYDYCPACYGQGFITETMECATCYGLGMLYD